MESYKREKPSFYSWLEKTVSATLSSGELHLIFHARDRFAGERILKERDVISARVSQIAGAQTRLTVAFQDAPADSAQADPRVDLLRKVFRGEVVKGEGHGDQPL